MATFVTLMNFNGTTSLFQQGGLLVDAAGDLLGAVAQGGANGDGVIFELAKTDTGYAAAPTTVVSFNGADGSGPNGNLIMDAAGNLYGTTVGGGASNDGTVFEIANTGGTNGSFASTPTTLVNLKGPSAGVPSGGLVMDAAGDLFGNATRGGPSNPFYNEFDAGAVFEVAKTSSGYASSVTEIDAFSKVYPTLAYGPQGSLLTDAAGDLFGVVVAGVYNTDPSGSLPSGAVYEYTKTSTGYAVKTLISVYLTQGQISPNLVMDAAGDLFGMVTSPPPAGDNGTIFEIAKTATGYASSTVLAKFSQSDGTLSGLVMDAAGNLYGTTSSGGDFGDGTLFEIVKTATGYASSPTTLVEFDGANGKDPVGSLTFDASGDLFGITDQGGTNNQGTIFEWAAPTPQPVSISGTAQEGQTLTATTDSNVAAYQWQVLVGGIWLDIADATASSFVVQPADDGWQIRVVVTDDAGNTLASAPTDAVLDAAGNQAVYETADSFTIGGGVFQYVYGTATNTTVNSGGEQNIYATGNAVTATLNAGGSQVDWGMASYTILDGGNQYVWGTATDTVINTGNQYVEAGGSAALTKVNSGGEQDIYTGGVASQGTIDGLQFVYGTVNGMTITANGFQYVYGTATNTTVDNQQDVYAGGTAIGTTLIGYSTPLWYLYKGWQYYVSSTSASQVDWGTAINTTIDGYSIQYVWGTATNTTIVAGTQYVAGSATGTTIDSYSQQIVDGGGTASGTTIAGGSQILYGAADQTTISSSGFQYDYGSATNTTVNNGGEQNVYADGTASGTTLNTGGIQVDWGAASNTTINGGTQYVWGTATNTTMTSGTQYVAGSATGTTIDSGSQQIVYGGGTTSGTTLAGGSQILDGAADQTTIGSGSFQYDHGSATNTTVNNGGEQNVYADGTASGTTLNTGGIQVDWGAASNTTINGGTQYVWGSATGTTINSGTQDVGGSASNTTIGSGGTEHVFTGGSADGVTFAGPSAALVLDQSSAFTGAVAGWQTGDSIDLGDIGFGSGSTLGYAENADNSGGTLTVSDGTHTATLALLGQYMATSFATSSDGNGGTLITDPAMTSQAHTMLAASFG